MSSLNFIDKVRPKEKYPCGLTLIFYKKCGNNRLDSWGNLDLMAEYQSSQILVVLSVSSANRKLKTSTILQLIAQTSKRNSSLSAQIFKKSSFPNPLEDPALSVS